MSGEIRISFNGPKVAMKKALLVGIVAVLLFGTAGCADKAPVHTFVAHGEVTLAQTTTLADVLSWTDTSSALIHQGDSCTGYGTYSDIVDGGAVTVDAAGQTYGMGFLGAGQVALGGPAPFCVFPY